VWLEPPGPLSLFWVSPAVHRCSVRDERGDDEGEGGEQGRGGRGETLLPWLSAAPVARRPPSIAEEEPVAVDVCEHCCRRPSRARARPVAQSVCRRWGRTMGSLVGDGGAAIALETALRGSVIAASCSARWQFRGVGLLQRARVHASVCACARARHVRRTRRRARACGVCRYPLRMLYGDGAP